MSKFNQKSKRFRCAFYARFVRSTIPKNNEHWEIIKMLIAFSGGLDSTVLLWVFSQLRNQLPPLRAIHVHHGLHPQAEDWAHHCRRVCKELNIPLIIEKENVKKLKGDSVEAVARKKRHQ